MAFFYAGGVHVGHAFLACFGLLLCHASVDSINDYFDYRSGLDLKTPKTLFSGGSGLLPAGVIPPIHALYIAIGSLAIAAIIGIYFVLSAGLELLPLLIIAAGLIVLYTPLITRLGWVEWAPGIGMGSLPVIGFYFVLTGEYTLPVILVSLPSGILVHNLLLANEFPDAEADRHFGRKTLPIILGYKNAGLVYAGLTGMVYLLIVIYVVMGLMPPWCLAGLLTLPWAYKASKGLSQYTTTAELIPAMTSNVVVVLLTQGLLALGYFTGGII